MSSAIEATQDPEAAERPIVDNTNTKFDDVEPLEHGDIWPRRIFAIACLIAVSTDPLFFYIPLIDEANKCLKMDKKVRIAALLFRSLTDAIFIVQLIYEIIQEFYPEMMYLAPKRVQRSWKMKLPYLVKLVGEMILEHDIPIPWCSIITFFLAILPIPQVLLLAVFLKKRGVGYVRHGMKFLNFFLLAQYVPRIFSLQQSLNKLKSTRLGVKIAYNFFLYILACHILGAIWYFFSIQREMSCWSHACEKNSTCSSTFYCDGSNSRNIGLLDQSCPINPSNATTFDFGIFLDSLKSRSNGSINLSVKFFYSFWWGVRNLSSFGSNMQTSTYVWENCFATLITIFGLLLFLYLIGNNVQTYMQLRTERLEKEAAKAEETKKKMDAQLPYIHKWMRKFDLPVYIKRGILAVFKEKVNKNVDMRTLISAHAVLPRLMKEMLGHWFLMDVPFRANILNLEMRVVLIENLRVLTKELLEASQVH